MKKFWTIAMCIGLPLFMASCSKGKTESIFGNIPSIYENQFAELAKEVNFIYTNQGDRDAADVAVKQKADSVIAIAFDLAKPEATRLKGYQVDFAVDEDVPFAITSEMNIRAIEVLRETGETVVSYAYLTFDLDPKEELNELYYVFTGEFGDIGAGVYSCPKVVKEAGSQIIRLPMPDVPAKYAERCQSVRFVSQKTYEELKDVLEIRQFQWKLEYQKSLEDMQ